MPGLRINVDASSAKRASGEARQAFRDIGRSATQAETKVEAMNRAFTGMKTRAATATRAMGRMAQSATSLQAAAGVAAGAAGLGYLANRSLESSHQLQKLSNATGFSVERIQELRFAAQQTGMSSARLDDAIGELAQRMGEAAADGGEMAEGFKAAGIAIDNLANRNPGAVFNQVADAISRAETQSKALNIAVKVFGDEGGREMVSLLREGSQRINEFATQARRMGLVLDKEVVHQASQAEQKIDLLVQVLGKQFQRVMGELAPDISEVADSMGDWVSNNQDFLTQDIPSHINSIASSVSGFAQSVASIPGPVLSGGLSAVMGARVGSAFGPYGAAAGAGIGLATSQGIEAYQSGARGGAQAGGVLGLSGSIQPAVRENQMQQFQTWSRYADIMPRINDLTLKNSQRQKQNTQQMNQNTRATRRNTDAKNKQKTAYEKVIDRLEEQIKRQQMTQEEYRKQQLLEEAQVEQYSAQGQKIQEMVDKLNRLRETKADRALDDLAQSSDNLSGSMDQANQQTNRMNQNLDNLSRKYEQTARSAGKLSQAARNAGASNVSGGGGGTGSALTREGGPLSGAGVPIFPLTLRDRMQIPYWQRQDYGGGSFGSDKPEEEKTSPSSPNRNTTTGTDIPTIKVEQKNYGINDPFEIAARIEDELIKRMKSGKMREAIQEVAAGRA